MPDWNFGPWSPFVKRVAKAEALWNSQNLSSEAANKIREAVVNKLKTPDGTCWNSFYDSCVVLLEVLEDPDKKDALNWSSAGRACHPSATMTEISWPSIAKS
jgi:hypothetical protein